mmetsp:Transcript_11232/g.32308  ORF Transcript_11232/g.32308 Transcript_11232/m.32308 type:complete len:240 (+) Transcript_11232:438-1157(+)
MQGIHMKMAIRIDRDVVHGNTERCQSVACFQEGAVMQLGAQSEFGRTETHGRCEEGTQHLALHAQMDAGDAEWQCVADPHVLTVEFESVDDVLHGGSMRECHRDDALLLGFFIRTQGGHEAVPCSPGMADIRRIECRSHRVGLEAQDAARGILDGGIEAMHPTLQRTDGLAVQIIPSDVLRQLFMTEQFQLLLEVVHHPLRGAARIVRLAAQEHEFKVGTLDVRSVQEQRASVRLVGFG